MDAKAKPNVMTPKMYWALLFSILTISLAVKLVRLNVPSDFYFDEVYHGFTATYYLHNDSEAYNMYYKNPPGRAIEWTHPPLAKLFMALSMVVFGENSFGWRFSSALAGTVLIFFTALLALELFESQMISLLSAFLLSVEGLVFVQSRIAMNDAHLMAFVFMCLYFFVRWRKNPENLRLMLWSGVGLGLALSCKWTALFVYFILALDRLATWRIRKRAPALKELNWFFSSFIIVPAAVYLLSYAHFFWSGYSWAEFIHLQNGMWWYHTNLKASHPYKSVPYQWLFNMRPVWLYVDYSVPEHIANIYNVGNSVVLYFGLASVIGAIQELWAEQGGWRGFVSAVRSVVQVVGIRTYAGGSHTNKVVRTATRGTRDIVWNWRLWLCVSAYFMVWLPWIFSPRIMLFYHYAPAVPMLCILLARNLERGWREEYRRTVIGIVLAAFAWFVLFYPHYTALPVPKSFADHVYFIFPAWK